jgi:Domain of unknown function (DUF4398)
MKLFYLWSVLPAAILGGCGSNFPEPKDAMAQSEAAVRGASEVGAEKVPEASLQLKFARDEIQEAKKLIDAGDNKRAAFVLQRAKADAELALMMAKTATTQSEARQAQEQIGELKKKVGK